ncbi:MAG: gamma carbonic anhydrase family protein [Candidatus Lokiarchaeota archaeon]|nr:gamma carbonic anhydrase family protein [Candidatus Lokiarchaeota archaeon]
MKIYEMEGKRPKISENVAFIADDVTIIGDVNIEEGVTIFPGVIIEGYPIKVKIKKYSNIQSGTVIHGLSGYETIIGSYNTIGHRCIIHGCKLESNVTIGIGSIIMGKTTIGENSFVGAGSLVTQNNNFQPNSLILGSPAKCLRKLTQDEIDDAMNVAKLYSEEGIKLSKNLKKII